MWNGLSNHGVMLLLGVLGAEPPACVLLVQAGGLAGKTERPQGASPRTNGLAGGVLPATTAGAWCGTGRVAAGWVGRPPL